MKILVYTANIGGKDGVQPQPPEQNVEYVYYSDNPINDRPWKHMWPVFRDRNNRRTARMHKVQPHKIKNDDVDYTIWIDASVQLKVKPSELVNCLGDNLVASFRHPTRSCIYEEAKVCSNYNLDVPSIIEDQMNRYIKENYPYNNGLIESQIVVVKHTPETRKFLDIWIREIIMGSQRDQLSANYALWKAGLKWSTIPREYAVTKQHNRKTGIIN